MNTIDNAPDILYKYRCCSKRHILMLINNEIYFTKPLEFNDPFDCLAQENSFSNLSENIIKEHARAVGVDENLISNESTKKVIDIIKSRPFYIEFCALQKIALSNYLENLGVFCLSENCTSILMWSHYSNYHSGFCIGFKSKNFGCPIRQVEYSKIRNNDVLIHHAETMGMSDADRSSYLFRHNILKKHIDWSYEQEWRIVGSPGIAFYDSSSIDHIIFGLKMPQDKREEIFEILKDKNITFYEAVKSETMFLIEIKRLGDCNDSFENKK